MGMRNRETITLRINSEQVFCENKVPRKIQDLQYVKFALEYNFHLK